MGRKKKSDDDDSLTALELEVMTSLWRRGQASVHEVLEDLPQYAYTTLSTILRLLLGRGIVSARSLGRQHTYVPELAKDAYESRALGRVVETVFDGEPSSLVRRLINDKSLTRADLDEIQALLDSRRRK